MTTSDDKITCIKCGRSRKAEAEFFMMRDGKRYNMCKDCLCQHVKNDDPETFK